MKYLINLFVLVFFFMATVTIQAQEKQTLKKETKVEKVEKKDACCSKEKSEPKVEKKESCDTKSNSSHNETDSETDDCCKTDKTKSSNSKEHKQ